MTNKTDQAKDVVERLSTWADVTTRPLFGAIALYRGHLVFAMVWKGAVYFKVDDNTRKDFDAAGSRALEYHSQGKPQALKSYMEAPADVLEDDETLVQWAEKAYRAAINSHH